MKQIAQVALAGKNEEMKLLGKYVTATSVVQGQLSRQGLVIKEDGKTLVLLHTDDSTSRCWRNSAATIKYGLDEHIFAWMTRECQRRGIELRMNRNCSHN